MTLFEAILLVLAVILLALVTAVVRNVWSGLNDYITRKGK